VQAVRLPSKHTSQDSLDDAREQAKMLGISLETIPIKDPVTAIEEQLYSHLAPNAPPVTFENLQSRTRGVLLMALSNSNGKLLLSTGNKSESAVGYATLYGDMCGGFNLLKDLYKTQVYALSRWRNTQSPVIPGRVLTKAPTAELRPGQTDQDSLPPYDILDDILYHAIERDCAAEEITAQGHDPETVRTVLTMVRRAEYKRRQAAPGPKISSRAFGTDRRYPITNGFDG
jgi:NAD+ synthase